MSVREWTASAPCPHATLKPAPISDADDIFAEEFTAPVALEVVRSRKGDSMPDHERRARLMALALAGTEDATISEASRQRYREAFHAFTRPSRTGV